MTPRNLFRIILKVIAIFQIEDVITSAIQSITSILSFSYSYDGTDTIAIMISSLLILAVYYAVFHLLLFKTDTVIDKLKLDEGFTIEEFSFMNKGDVTSGIDYRTILELAIMITGVYILINEVPNFIQQLVSYYQQRRAFEHIDRVQIPYIALSFAKLIIAYILLTTHTTIVDYFVRKRVAKDVEEN